MKKPFSTRDLNLNQRAAVTVCRLCFAFLLVLTAASGRAETAGDFTYTVNAGVATITGYSGPGGLVVVPGMAGIYPVTGVGANVFANSAAITGVGLPSNIANIGNAAFQNCANLAGAYFLGNAPAMGSDVFSGVAGGFSVYFVAGKTGFTAPNWQGYPSATFVPEAQYLIADSFALAMTAFNAKNAGAFGSHIAADYLDYGDTKADLVANLDDPEWSPMSYAMETPAVNGGQATAVVHWVGDEAEIMTFRLETGNWLLYGNQKLYPAECRTHCGNNPEGNPEYRIYMQVEDPEGSITGVTVAGPGIPGGVSLNWQPGFDDEEASWVSWSTSPENQDVSPGFSAAQRPAVGSVYTFTINVDDGRGIVVQDEVITGYVETIPVNLVPAPDSIVTDPNPVFSWNSAGQAAEVELYLIPEGDQHDHVWDSGDADVFSPLPPYNGPALQDGATYCLHVTVCDGFDNQAQGSARFTYDAEGGGPGASLFAAVEILRSLEDGANGLRGLFEVDVEAPEGKTVTVTVPTAPATVFDLEEDAPGEYEYFVNTLDGLAALNAQYPQGNYTLRLYADAGKQTLEEELTVTFGNGAGGPLAFPEVFPVLTQPVPANHAATANTLQTYTWNAYAGTPGTASHMGLSITGTGEMDEDVAEYQAVIGGACAYTPHLNGQAVPAGLFDLELSFLCRWAGQGAAGTQIACANERYARHALTVTAEGGGPGASLFAAVEILRSLEDGANGLRGLFEVDVEAPEGKTVTVTVPTAPATVFDLEEDAPGEYEYFVNTLDGLAALNAQYPQGNYTLRLYADAGKQTLEEELTVTFGNGAGGPLAFPEVFPVLTQPLPANHAATANTLQTYTWNAYAGTPGTASHMGLSITGTGEMDEDVAEYQAVIGGACAYTPHLNGQAVPAGLFDLELSFLCRWAGQGAAGTQIACANERYARHALTVTAPPGAWTVTLKSSAATLAAGQDDFAKLNSGDTGGLVFAPALVGAFGTFTPPPADAPEGTAVINIPPGDGRNGFFKITFNLPADFTNIQLAGKANADDFGRIFLNGNPLSTALDSNESGRITNAGDTAFSTTNAGFFVAGENILILSDWNSLGGPSGVAFYATVSFNSETLVNDPPEITAMLPEDAGVDAVAEGDLLPLAVTAADPDAGNTLAYAWHYSLNGGASWSLLPYATPQIIASMPFEAVQHPAASLDGGQLQVRVTVSDNWGAEDSHTWTVQSVQDRNRRPEARPEGEPPSRGWLALGTANQPTARDFPGSVWTGSRMLVWGGSAGGGGMVNTGGSYAPDTATWMPLSTASAPQARFGHSVVWTGAKMLVWGGRTDGWSYTNSSLNTGGLYDSFGDSWTATSTTNAPAARGYHAAVWTGTKMLVWGGAINTGSYYTTATNTGGIYDPATNTWTTMSTTGAPPAAFHSAAVWIGTKMLVWGGMYGADDHYEQLNTGGIYDPATDTWAPMSMANAPGARNSAYAVWTGAKLLVWGGRDNSGALADGGIYDPATDTWAPMSTANAPAARGENITRTAVWTGSRMLVWGGSSQDTLFGDGGLYDPATDTWTAIPADPAAAPRYAYATAWTGRSFIVWGGGGSLAVSQLLQDGALLLPAPTAVINPAQPVTGDALTCTVADDVTDPDPEDIAGLFYEYTWRRNGEVFATRNSALRTDTLEAGTVVRGETWTCLVRVLDAAGAATAPGGAPAVIIGNTGPRVTLVSAAPATVAGDSANLVVTATDDAGEGNLTYEWSTLSAPAGAAAPQFSASGTNAAKNTQVTVFKAGAYRFQATARDADGLTAAGTVDLTVTQTLVAAGVLPSSLELNANDVANFSVSNATDQFGDPLAGNFGGQWQISSDAGGNWSDIAGAFGSSYARIVKGPDNGAWFRCSLDGGVTTATTTLTVKIQDNDPPVITILGANPASVFRGGAFADPGATAVDVVDGAVPVNAAGAVNTGAIGSYLVTYSAADAAANQATAQRTVNVVQPPPVIQGISPTTILDYNQEQNITLFGANFTPGAAVWMRYLPTGAPPAECLTTFNNPGALSFRKNFSGTPGAWQLTVRLAEGLESMPLTFSVGVAPKAKIMVSPDIMANLGTCEAGKTVSRQLIITNVGNAVLNGTAACAAPFSITAGAGYALYPGQSQALVVAYSPPAAGSHGATLNFSGAQGKTIELVGTAFAPRPTHGVLYGVTRDFDTGLPVGQIAVSLQGVGGVTAATGPDAGAFSLRVPGGNGYILQAWDTARPARYEPYRQYVYTLPAGVNLLNDIRLTPRQAGGGVAMRDIPVVLVRGSGRNLPWTAPEDPDGANPLLSEKAYWEALRQALAAATFSEVWDCNDGLTADRGAAGINGEAAFEANAARLEQFIATRLAQYKTNHGAYPPHIHLVGHGMGGLIIRHFLRVKEYASRNSLAVTVLAPGREDAGETVNLQIGKVFMLGTPNGGAPATVPPFNLPEWSSTRSMSPGHLHHEFNPYSPWPRQAELFLLTGTGGPGSDSNHMRNGHYAIQNYFKGISNGQVGYTASDGLTSAWSVLGTRFQGEYVTYTYSYRRWFRTYYYTYSVFEVKRYDSFACDYLADTGRNKTDSSLLGRALDHRQLVTDSGVHAWLATNLMQPVSTAIPAGRGVNTPERDDPPPAGDNTQIAARVTGELAPGAAFDLEFVNDADAALTVDIVAPAGATAALFRPDDTEVQAADPGVTLSVTVAEDGSTLSRYSIAGTVDGAWLARVDGAALAEAGAYEITAAVDSAVVAFPVQEAFFRQGSPVALACGLADLYSPAQAPVRQAAASAVLTHPDGSSQALDLFDDGLHGDRHPGDGILGIVLPALPSLGNYRVQYRLTGVHADGVTLLQRAVDAEFAIIPAVGQVAGVDGHELLDADGDGQADFIHLQCRILAAENTTFSLRGTLKHEAGGLAVHAESQAAAMPEGENEVSLMFSLAAFAEAGAQGALALQNLQLFQVGADGVPSWADEFAGSYSLNLGPSINEQPLDRRLQTGQAATFSVAASGSGVLAYQWRKDGVDMADGGRIAGAATAVLTIADVQGADAGAYSVVVTDSHWATVSRDAVLGENVERPAAVMRLEPPLPGGREMIGTVEFSTPVTGFAMDDIQITGGVAGNFIAHDAATYSFDLTTAAGAPGVLAHVPEGAAQDAAGNLNCASDGQAVLLLEAGWNLVSLPVQPAAAAPAKVFARADGAGAVHHGPVWQWTPDGAGGGVLEQAAAMQAMRGYWVYLPAAATVLVNGALPEPATVNLARGWNLFGPAGALAMPLHPNAANFSWAWHHGAYKAVASLLPGGGYWLYLWDAATVDTRPE